jgi:oxaloacetate decarboxylase (Na+ extruding) subunit gamma
LREDELFMQGVELMLFGVSTVVIFLSLLVLAIGLASRVIQRFFPEAVPAQPARQGRSPVAPRTSGPTVDAQRSAVIAAAVHQHRQRHRNG